MTPGRAVANGYGMSEGVFPGPCGHGTHLPDDICIFETVDAEGRPVEPGTLSHCVLVTNLYNHTQPLIRFEITDEVSVIDRPCPCGSSMRVLSDPQGRLDDIFVNERASRRPNGGSPTWPASDTTARSPSSV